MEETDSSQQFKPDRPPLKVKNLTPETSELLHGPYSVWSFKQTGGKHVDSELPSQDALDIYYDKVKKFLIVSVADGLSTCPTSDKGAEILVKVAQKHLAENIDDIKSKLSPKENKSEDEVAAEKIFIDDTIILPLADKWIEQIKKAGLSIADSQATYAFTVFADGISYYFTLGDILTAALQPNGEAEFYSQISPDDKSPTIASPIVDILTKYTVKPFHGAAFVGTDGVVEMHKTEKEQFLLKILQSKNQAEYNAHLHEPSVDDKSGALITNSGVI